MALGTKPMVLITDVAMELSSAKGRDPVGEANPMEGV